MDGSYTRILVPLDGSALAERAMPFACRLAEQHGAELLLTNVVEPCAAVAPDGPAAAHARHSAIGLAQTYLERTAAGLTLHQPIQTAIYFGEAVEGILEEVRLRRPDLVVMATHGRTGLRVVLGSVADAVARRSPVPVLLVPPACRITWGSEVEDRPLTVLAPLDGSALAEESLTALRTLARGTALRVTLYGVVQLLPALYYAGGSTSQMQDTGAEIDSLESYLAHQASRLSRVADVRTQVELGSAARRISEHASAAGVDLVVMANHGRGGLSRLLLGSVATSVLHQLEVPLLLVRAQSAGTPIEQPRALSGSKSA